MSPYTYSALPHGTHSIRLLRLLPDQNYTATIRCSLFKYALTDTRRGCQSRSMTLVLLLFEQQGGSLIRITANVVETIVRNEWWAHKMLKFLLKHRADEIDVTKTVVSHAISNQIWGAHILELLSDRLRGSGLVTDKMLKLAEGNVVSNAISNEVWAENFLKLLSDRAQGSRHVTDKMLDLAEGNEGCEEEVLSILRRIQDEAEPLGV